MASIGPGPVYSLPSTIGYENHDQRKVRNPQYSFGGRTKLIDKNIVPGPNFNVTGLTRYGPARTYAYSMAPRSNIKDIRNIGPGPANYDLNKSPYVNGTSPPSYSMGQRTALSNKNICPGPNAYGSIKSSITKPSAPAFSIGIRTGLKSKFGSPGPANYSPSSLKTYLPKAPEFSLGPRTTLKSKLVGPGANAYDCMNYRPGKSAPIYSFGLRHSQRAPPMIVACDNI